MKSIKIISFFICAIFIHCTLVGSGQITRGALPGEIYLSTQWYHDGYILHYGIFHSIDNGYNLELVYQNIANPPSGQMGVATVTGDASNGFLYNYSSTNLWVSMDYGEDWDLTDENYGYAKYFSGSLPGLVFKGNNDGLFKSTDYGHSFELLPITVTCPFTELGYYENEFFGINGESGIGYNIVHSLDYGQTYTEIPLDTTIALWQIWDRPPKVVRGASSGELYLVSWWPDISYKIFHSVDTGYTWTQQYVSAPMDHNISYTPGREQGSFYVMRLETAPDQTHNWLYIDYSCDYAQTFTTYFHDLEPTFGIDRGLVKSSSIKTYPNPFSQFITFELPNYDNGNVVQIFEINGNLVKELESLGDKDFIWDATNQSGQKVSEGTYLFRVLNNDNQVTINKIIYIKN